MERHPRTWLRAFTASVIFLALAAAGAAAQGEGEEARLGFHFSVAGEALDVPLDVEVAREGVPQGLMNSTDGSDEASFTLGAGEYHISVHLRDAAYPTALMTFEPSGRVSSDGAVVLGGGEELLLEVSLPSNFTDDADGNGLYDWWENATSSGGIFGPGEEGQPGEEPTLGEGDPKSGDPENPPPGGSGEDPSSIWEDPDVPPLMVLGVLLVIMFAAAGMAYSKISRERILDHTTRECIFNYIKDKPGVHLRGIKKDLGLAMGVLNHHLRRLEQEELIKSRAERQYKRYYPYYYSMKDHPILSRGQREVYKTIVENPGISPPQVAMVMGRSRRNVYNHVNSLEKMGLIRTRKDGKTLKCYIVDAA